VSVSVLAAAGSLREALAGFEPGVFSGSDCVRLAQELAATEKACAAARVLAGARAVETGAYREEGSKDGAAWLARTSGATGAQSRHVLDTAKRLEDCPETKAALLAGELSLAQAGEIVMAESETPGAEQTLLAAAKQSDLSQLRDQARAHRQAHTPVEDLHRRQQQARFFRQWRDRLGMVCFSGALPPETGLPFIRRVELATQRARRGIDRRGRWEADAADALAALTAGGNTSKRSDRAELVIVCDLYAWRRGHTHPGEVCQLLDGGALPVELAKELAQDAFLSAALHDGVNIHTVKRFGRYQPAELRTALDLGPVPQFTGRQCADCGRRWGLQYDHVDPVAHQGPTSYANLAPRCWTCHSHKTEQDRKAGLLGAHAPRPPNRP
jgi:hypothetical protein